MPATEGRLHIQRDGSGPPLLLLHGLGATSVSWSQVLPMLTERHEVLAPDLPGHGRSPRLPDGVRPSVEALADVVEEEVERLLPGPPPIVGNSLGGEIALELAVRGKAPCVVALSPSGLSTALERTYIKSSARAGHLVARLLAPASGVLAANPLARAACFALVRNRPWRMTREEASAELSTTARSMFLETLREVEDRSAAESLPKIGCPVLVAFGTNDRLLGMHQGQRFLELIPDARLEHLPGAGHVPMSDDPVLVARTILDFVREHDGR